MDAKSKNTRTKIETSMYEESNVPGILLFLDALIVRAHRIHIFGFHYHPYLLFSDIATIAIVVFGFIFSYTFDLVWWHLVVLIGMIRIGYPLFLWLKARFFRIKTRVYLEDLLFYFVPSGLIGAEILQFPRATLLDFCGLAAPLGLAIGRIGCFLGACCHGSVSSRYGVFYPSKIWDCKHLFRRFTPSPYLGCRLFPLQLVESGYNILLFTALLLWISKVGVGHGRTFPIYLILYSVFRFFAEFARGDRSRPYFGPLSEAQWISIAAFLIGCAVIT